ncbi:cuticle protein 65-like [Ctenocephalides felis]|uniref:cuticle protein 65-like n=1 Tax=Ctenocephalides felis TaxID=7515 RepID=UPI000E6E3EA6|nr:cuticle protein 65-like [Ctenocephalides felis]XP_026463301.1 cuticle protein 65-like [Ctenocephalides felis]
MFKVVIFWMCVAAACAGYVGTPLAYSAAPLVYSAPSSYAVPAAYVKSYPLATSYANTYKVSLKSPVYHAAPLPLAYSHYDTPLSYASPLGYGHGYGHGYGYGYGYHH